MGQTSETTTQEGLIAVGMITRYFSNLGVAGVSVPEGSIIRMGDTLRTQNRRGNPVQFHVDSMEHNHRKIEVAIGPTLVGIEAPRRVRHGAPVWCIPSAD